MKISDIIGESAWNKDLNKSIVAESDGKMVNGMLVQSLDDFVQSQGITPKHMGEVGEIEEALEPGESPVIFHAKPKGSYSAEPTDASLSPERAEYAKVIDPDEIAKMVHHMNSYVIYYEFKATDDPSKKLTKRITTDPIYVPMDKIEEISKESIQQVEQKFPNLSAASKKNKAYNLTKDSMAFLAVEEAKKHSPEVKYAISQGILPNKLKAKQFTTTAAKAKNPNIHRGNVPIIDESGKIIYDLDGLAAKITARPKELLKVNSKMTKSSGETVIVTNIGIPAIAGLVVDEKSKQFVVVNTCPGAGECKAYCYATRGGYIQWPNSGLSQSQVLNYWYNDPNGFRDQVIAEVKRKMKSGAKVYLRWHDSGDFFVDAYLHLAFEVARALPDVTIYAYTKIASVATDPARPANFLINFSDGAKPSETSRVSYKDTKHSIVVPAALFKDEKVSGVGLERLQNRDPEAQKTLKQILANEYGIDVKSLITYDEMMDMPETSDKPIYNVIIVPGLDGDLAAARRDVLGSFLLYH